MTADLVRFLTLASTLSLSRLEWSHGASVHAPRRFIFDFRKTTSSWLNVSGITVCKCSLNSRFIVFLCRERYVLVVAKERTICFRESLPLQLHPSDAMRWSVKEQIIFWTVFGSVIFKRGRRCGHGRRGGGGNKYFISIRCPGPLYGRVWWALDYWLSISIYINKHT